VISGAFNIGMGKTFDKKAAKPFVSFESVQQKQPRTANFSHGEIVRAGVDETLEIDPANVRAHYALGIFFNEAPGIAGGSTAT
jgi:hypothetical protein